MSLIIQSYKTYCIFYISFTVPKYLKQCQERGYVGADSLKVLSSVAGKIELQDCSMLVTLHLQPGNIERFMNSDADAQHSLSAQHFVSVGLNSQFDFFLQRCLSGNTLTNMPRNVSQIIDSKSGQDDQINYLKHKLIPFLVFHMK